MLTVHRHVKDDFAKGRIRISSEEEIIFKVFCTRDDDDGLFSSTLTTFIDDN